MNTKYSLARQMYGIAMAQCVYGGPRGVWLECTSCNESQRVVGKGAVDEPDAVIAKVFRAAGWTGMGAKMLKAKCPKCSAQHLRAA